MWKGFLSRFPPKHKGCLLLVHHSTIHSFMSTKHQRGGQHSQALWNCQAQSHSWRPGERPRHRLTAQTYLQSSLGPWHDSFSPILGLPPKFQTFWVYPKQTHCCKPFGPGVLLQCTHLTKSWQIPGLFLPDPPTPIQRGSFGRQRDICSGAQDNLTFPTWAEAVGPLAPLRHPREVQGSSGQVFRLLQSRAMWPRATCFTFPSLLCKVRLFGGLNETMCWALSEWTSWNTVSIHEAWLWPWRSGLCALLVCESVSQPLLLTKHSQGISCRASLPP